MPTYEYRCSACGHTFERFQSITAAPVTRCPECNKNKVQRLIGTGAGLIFKGSGFYITDYRSESYKNGARADKSEGSSSSSSNGSPSSSSDSSSSTKAESSGGKTGNTK